MKNLRKITAFVYHDIVPDARYELSGFQSPDADIYKLDVEVFSRQLREIARQGYRAVRLDAELPRNDRALLLTFDDGGSSAVLYTAEALGEFNWPAHFFVTTDRIGDSGFLDPAQIRDLREMGHVVGSHSCSHPPRMSHLTEAELMREWRDSTQRLEDILGEKVEAAAVPGGYYSRKVGTAAAAAGLRFLFTSEPVTSIQRVDGCLVIGRFSVAQGTTTKWVGAVASGQMEPRLKSYLLWNGKKLLKAAGGQLWLDARRYILARRTS